MRYLLLILIILIVQVKDLYAQISAKDSLLQVLSTTTDVTKQVNIYRDLADLVYEKPEELGYLYALYKKAETAGQTEVALEALSDLTLAYVDNQQADSIENSMKAISYLASNNDEDQWKCYLNMYIFRSEVMKGNGTEIINRKMKSYDEKETRSQSLYKQVEDAFVLGVGYYEQNRIKDAVHYFETALEAAKKLSLKEGCRYRLKTSRMLAAAYSSNEQHDKVIAIMEEVIRIQDNYYELYCKERPFYPIDILHIYNYSSLLMNAEFMPEDRVQLYLKQLIKLSESATCARSKYSYFFGINNYYLSRKNYEKALMCNDSMIKYAIVDYPSNVPMLYGIRSQIYEAMGKPAEALTSLKKSYQMQDSLITQGMREKLNDFQVKYDVNRLEYEKSQLEVHIKRIMVIWLSVVLLLIVVLCVYLYVNLKTERKKEKQLHLLKQRVEENKKIKTAFVNSICQEIRTPVNAIVGFTDSILDESLEKDVRMIFPQEIKNNSTILTSLVDSMRECKLNCVR